jgi:hypothetical protein
MCDKTKLREGLFSYTVLILNKRTNICLCSIYEPFIFKDYTKMIFVLIDKLSILCFRNLFLQVCNES